MSVSAPTADGEQSSIVYGFDSGDEIRELYRAGRGEILERGSTKSDLTDRLPELPIPGTDGLQQPDCGDEIPAFACESCGNPVYVGRTCGSPSCSRCWASAVKEKATRYAGKLEGYRRKEYANNADNIDFNHVVASLPDFVVESDQPVERALSAIKELLRENWNVWSFAAVFHPYRIKVEHRADQYEHDGEPGEGDMTWADVLDKENPYQYLKHEPHFHLFFATRRKGFDYLTAEAVEDQSGWLFHRITKGEDSNVSVSDLDDLVHQLTYSLSHAGVNSWHANRDELTTRMKGQLHQCYIPDDAKEEILASFCKAAPRLLGTHFANLSDATCSADLDPTDGDDTEPMNEVWEPEPGIAVSSSKLSRQSAPISGGGSGGSDTTATGAATGTTATGESNVSSVDLDAVDDVCGGSLVPMYEAKPLLDDPDWCDDALYADGLRRAVDEWEALDDIDKAADRDVIRGD
jgi:hypothetical protein